VTEVSAATVAHSGAGPASQVDKYLVFAFGVVFVSVLLWLVFRSSDPLNEDQAQLVRLVSALAAAGVAAAVPGVSRTTLRYRTWLRAGGAIVVFIVVFVYQPQRAVAPDIWPVRSASEAIERHLTLTDAGKYDEAYDELSSEGKRRFSRSEFVSAFKAGREGFGPVQQRVMTGLTGMSTLPDGTHGPFKVYSYVTTFQSGTTVLEPVWAVAEGKRDWKVVFHNVLPCPGNQCATTLPAAAASTP
jgi:hypothetical protein